MEKTLRSFYGGSNADLGPVNMDPAPQINDYLRWTGAYWAPASFEEPEKNLTETVRNAGFTMLPKGTPVRIVGNSGQEANVVAANATDSFPAHLILNQDLLAGASGEAVAIGFINNVSVPDASIFTAGQEVYLGPTAGWTTTRPTGTNKIQKLGTIVKPNIGANTVSGIINIANIQDLPNLSEGRVWIGNSSGLAEEFNLTSELAAAYQPLNADLTAIAALSGSSGIARKTAANTWTLDITQAPMTNLPYWPLGSAITVANDTTDATNDIQFIANGKAVQCRDINGNMLWVTPPAGTVIKQADATWASGTNAGGRGSGVSFTANTEYYLFLITNGTLIDYGFDTSITAANLRTSTGWQYYRPVGWNKATTGPAWRTFRRDGIWHWWRNQWIPTSTVGGAVATVNIDAPTGFDCQSLLRVSGGQTVNGKNASFWVGSATESNPSQVSSSWVLGNQSSPVGLSANGDIPLMQNTNIVLLVVGGQMKTFGWETPASIPSSASTWIASTHYPNYLVRGFSLENLING